MRCVIVTNKQYEIESTYKNGQYKLHYLSCIIFDYLINSVLNCSALITLTHRLLKMVRNVMLNILYTNVRGRQKKACQSDTNKYAYILLIRLTSRGE